MFSVFSNLEVADVEAPEDEATILSDLTASVTTVEGVSADTYDFDFSLSKEENSFIGMEGKNLRIIGSGKVQDTEFTYEVPVEKMRLSCDLGPAESTEILQYN